MSFTDQFEHRSNVRERVQRGESVSERDSSNVLALFAGDDRIFTPCEVTHTVSGTFVRHYTRVIDVRKFKSQQCKTCAIAPDPTPCNPVKRVKPTHRTHQQTTSRHLVRSRQPPSTRSAPHSLLSTATMSRCGSRFASVRAGD